MLPPYFSAFSASPGLRPPKERRHAPGVMDTPFPLFITFKSGRAATSFIPASFSRRISGYSPIPPRIFLLRTEAYPLNPPTRDRRPCPSIRTTSDRKPTSIVSTFSSLHSCARSSSTSSSPKTSTTASRRPSTCRSSSSRGSPSSISGGRDTS